MGFGEEDMKAWQLITVGAIGFIALWVVWTIREQLEAYAKGLTDILAEAKKSTSELSAGLVQPTPPQYLQLPEFYKTAQRLGAEVTPTGMLIAPTVGGQVTPQFQRWYELQALYGGGMLPPTVW